MNESEIRDVDPRDSGYRSEQNMESGPQEMAGNGTGGLSIGDYQRLRKGYERAINPDALQKMNPAAEPEASYHHEDDPGDELPQRRDSVQTSRRVVRIRPETHPSVDPERAWQGDYREEPRRRGGIGPFAIISILLIGLIGGLVLYAGGADYIAGLFGGGEEEYGEDLTLVTERPGADLETPDATPTPGDMVADDETAVEDGVAEESVAEVIPEEDIAKAEAEEKAAAEKKRLEAQKAAEAKRAEERRIAAAEKARAEAAAARAPSRETPSIESPGEREAQSANSTTSSRSNETTSSSPGRYTAQVGATPDRSEADRIASRLRARGGSGVTVVTAEKDGAPIYRVRFGSFSSEEEARRQSSQLGFSDVWIIER